MGPGAWHPLDPSWVPLPVLRGRLKILEARGQGLASPDPFLGASPWCVSTTDHGSCGGGSACAYAGDLIVVCQCHRSCRYVEVASLYGVLPQAQFLDKVVDMPVASMTGALGGQCSKLCLRSCSADTWVDVPVVQVVDWVSWCEETGDFPLGK